ncbi:DUF3775 domain-containing protein [Halovulum dunhuangense]|uniref:DUF3775 domain-containing protein n=1 Tax=Halovulum dunhuangense TaxID=1505036 RepID=A0A849L6R8_9RHOB|nr:DUF3775 domain-containing protein [Halovulum dunhuangense]NNU81943.1 DUF3775 domain-containing protein [Halovulum dunhuangense]
MDDLTIPADVLRDLILRMRNYMSREDLPTGGPGEDGPPDPDEIGPLSTDPDDPDQAELFDEIDGLDDEQQAELVALMWVGRGDFDAEDWAEAVALAGERHSGVTAEYLMSHPLVADYWAEGLERLFDGSDLLDTGRY